MRTRSSTLYVLLAAVMAMLLGIGGIPRSGIAAETRGAGMNNRQSPPRDDTRRGTEALTPEQVEQVKAILSRYNPNTLTAEEAMAIHEAFRQAGLRGGPAMGQAIRAAGFDPEKLRDLAPPPGQGNEGNQRPGNREGGRQEGRAPRQGERGQEPREQGKYSTEQAISDRAQLNTIAFDGLAFLTGDFGCNTFLPPGKVADFCGFQYMRDVDTNQLGHNTSFVPRAANNVLFILSDQQKAQLIALAKEQEKLLTDFAYKRFPLIQAFCRQLTGDIPTGSEGLNREAVIKYTAEFFEIDGLLSYRRAEVLGGIVRSLTEEQKTYLGKMLFNNSATWPEKEDQIDKRSLSHTVHVAVMTYASEMFSWYAGNVEADVYFCPERHATYFGSFYMKDIPAMGNQNYSISTSLTGDSGEAFLAALTEPQRKLVMNLVSQQRQDLTEIVKTRRAIATELRRFMKESEVDKEKVMSLSRRYGELDGEISYYYAMAFAEVGKTLTSEQKRTLFKLRNLDAKFTCKGAYLYSSAINMPIIPNTDFLFGKTNNVATVASPANPAPDTVRQMTFSLRSSAVENGGQLPVEFTGDGESATLPLEWSGAPEGTKGYAVIMHHIDPEGVAKWYWILYKIPATVQGIPKNVKGVGTLGNNSINQRTEYAPPRSKGPGAKTYIYTVYALSSTPELKVSPDQVDREILLAAMKDRILASAELQVVYTRQGISEGPGNDLGSEPAGDRPVRDPNRQGGQRPERSNNRQPRDSNRTDGQGSPSMREGQIP
jgi:phosphatidylethanolamine-binding protein (PEBP) family uncharacterized protein